MTSRFDTVQYFQRQSSVHGYGGESLERLREARVAVVGCGGVGSAAADYLARSGIGHLRLIDQDIVDPTNLHRVHSVGSADVYHSKAEAIAKTIVNEHPWLEAKPIVETVREANVDELLAGSDVVLDGLDNFRSRYVVNGFSVRTSTPYVFASAIANQAHAGVFHPPTTACLECAFPSVAPKPGENCESLGVTAPIIGLIGSIVASETVRFILGEESSLRGGLLTVDLAQPEFIRSHLSKRTDCSCGMKVSRPPKDGDPDLLCGENTASVTPKNSINLDLPETAKSLDGDSHLLSLSDRVLVYEEQGSVVSVFTNGRIIVRGVSSESKAKIVASKIWGKNAVPMASRN